ncbi:NADP-dependent oxidoreductase [Geosporobacter ferrireducens]|uniref:NADP-dependent oxidoreductase n=1 Tax=Geosporobacter ferrireducens TaxID=1424294 RepID=UPI00139B5CDB|nr:NADP-dependent oxidoreductase [Geosporobacter ferrireducens]MTI56680.1 NADP-dependent oxidoreductase [Geosporobacter ferrireducens]
MKAIGLTIFGNPGIFEEIDVNLPDLSDSQVLVEVKASSINPGDEPLRSGEIFKSSVGGQWSEKLPIFLGSDVAGIVKAVGKKVTRFKVDDRVMGLTIHSGAYQDFVAIDEDHLTKFSEDISYEIAGAAPTITLTAKQALFDHGNLLKGQRVLIQGGAGGVGHAAIQLAKNHGAYVITTARKNNHDFVKVLGADEVYDYTEFDIADIINEKVDLVLDTVMETSIIKNNGALGEVGKKSLTVIKDNGKYVSIVSFGLNSYPIERNIEAHFFQSKPNHSDFEKVMSWIEMKELQIHIDKIFSLSPQGIEEAYIYSKKQSKKGRISVSKFENK